MGLFRHRRPKLPMLFKRNHDEPYTQNDSYLAGPLTNPAGDVKVQFRTVMSRQERIMLASIMTVSTIIGIVFLGWLAGTGHVNTDSSGLMKVLAWTGSALI